MDSAYGNIYRELYERHWWWRARECAVVRELRRFVPPGGWRRVLDVGCGDGLLFERLREFAPAIDGVEPDARLLSRPDPQIHIGPFDTGFQPGQTYDVILMLDVLEHMDDPVAALGHAQQLLAPGGLLLITVPAMMWLWTNHDVINCHRLRYDRRKFAEVALAADLTIVRQRYLFQWTCPVKFLQGRMERWFGAPPENPGIPPNWVNRVLTGISIAENRLAEFLPFPFGSSLLVVARANVARKPQSKPLFRVAGASD